jgi:hypothetical protein
MTKQIVLCICTLSAPHSLRTRPPVSDKKISASRLRNKRSGKKYTSKSSVSWEGRRPIFGLKVKSGGGDPSPQGSVGWIGICCKQRVEEKTEKKQIGHLFTRLHCLSQYKIKKIMFIFYFFDELECAGRFFAYVAHLWFLRDVWIWTQEVSDSLHSPLWGGMLS